MSIEINRATAQKLAKHIDFDEQFRINKVNHIVGDTIIGTNEKLQAKDSYGNWHSLSTEETSFRHNTAEYALKYYFGNNESRLSEGGKELLAKERSKDEDEDNED